MVGCLFSRALCVCARVVSPSHSLSVWTGGAEPGQRAAAAGAVSASRWVGALLSPDLSGCLSLRLLAATRRVDTVFFVDVFERASAPVLWRRCDRAQSVQLSVSSSARPLFRRDQTSAWREQEHESIDCSEVPAVSRWGPGYTARGNPYNGCQKQRKKHDTNPSFLGWPPEGEITFRCASTLEADQRDYNCGQCTTGDSGCANDYAGEGFDTTNTPSTGALS